MADVEYIIPGGGIVNDTEEGAETIIPDVGIYQQQEASGSTILPIKFNIDAIAKGSNPVNAPQLGGLLIGG